MGRPTHALVSDHHAFWVLAALVFMGSAVATAASPDGHDENRDGAGFEAVVDPAQELFALPEPWGPLLATGAEPEQLLDTVVTLEHDVPLAGGETLHLHEFCTLRSWLQRPRRGALFLGGTALTASGWTVPVDGYNGPEMAARRGMFAFTVDFLGVGDHYKPGADGLDSTFERNQEALKVLVRYIRHVRAIPKLDLITESWGGAHATQLAADTERIRSCTMSSMSYQATNPMFLSPEFIGFLKSLEDNYMPGLDPALLGLLTAGARPGVKEYLVQSQTGPRLTSQLWQIIKSLPHFDPEVAKVPGLVISDDLEAADGRALAADYGGETQFLELPGGGHAPRISSPEIAGEYWRRVFEFIDDPAKKDE